MHDSLPAVVIAARARALGAPAEWLCDALAIATGTSWIPVCAPCLCSKVDPTWRLAAHRAADAESYCTRCAYAGIDVLAVEVSA